MNRPGESAGRLLWPVLLLGVAGDFLFRADHLGLNVALWVTGVVLLWRAASRRGADPQAESSGPATEPSNPRVTGTWERGLLLAALALAVAWAWRDNDMLRFLDSVGLVVVFALLPLASAPDAARVFARLTVAQVFRALVELAGRGASGLLPTLIDAGREPATAHPRSVLSFGSVARGLVMAVPAGIVFGGLLGSADPAFGEMLRGLVAVDPKLLAGHALGLTGAAWVAAALLRGGLPGAAGGVSAPSRPPLRGLGVIEIGMTLGLVDLLFAGFVVFQLPYLFGGSAWVERTAGVTLAEYARRGFFELVMVAALVLPLLLACNARLAPEDPRARRLFRSLAGVQLLLVFAIIGSGMHRMALYQREFGLTSDRFFASAFMTGLAVTCLWFMVTVLRGRPFLFARGVLLAWGAWLGLLNVVNPDRVIVETNIRRHAAGQTLDVYYLTRLSADAVPALVAHLPRLPEADRQIIRSELERRHDLYSGDLRDWHYGRARARRARASLH
jgi:hypothetical protein